MSPRGTKRKDGARDATATVDGASAPLPVEKQDKTATKAPNGPEPAANGSADSIDNPPATAGDASSTTSPRAATEEQTLDTPGDASNTIPQPAIEEQTTDTPGEAAGNIPALPNLRPETAARMKKQLGDMEAAMLGINSMLQEYNSSTKRQEVADGWPTPSILFNIVDGLDQLHTLVVQAADQITASYHGTIDETTPLLLTFIPHWRPGMQVTPSNLCRAILAHALLPVLHLDIFDAADTALNMPVEMRNFFELEPFLPKLSSIRSPDKYTKTLLGKIGEWERLTLELLTAALPGDALLKRGVETSADGKSDLEKWRDYIADLLAASFAIPESEEPALLSTLSGVLDAALPYAVRAHQKPGLQHFFFFHGDEPRMRFEPIAMTLAPGYEEPTAPQDYFVAFTTHPGLCAPCADGKVKILAKAEVGIYSVSALSSQSKKATTATKRGTDENVGKDKGKGKQRAAPVDEERPAKRSRSEGAASLAEEEKGGVVEEEKKRGRRRARSASLRRFRDGKWRTVTPKK